MRGSRVWQRFSGVRISSRIRIRLCCWLLAPPTVLSAFGMWTVSSFGRRSTRTMRSTEVWGPSPFRRIISSWPVAESTIWLCGRCRTCNQTAQSSNTTSRRIRQELLWRTMVVMLAITCAFLRCTGVMMATCWLPPFTTTLQCSIWGSLARRSCRWEDRAQGRGPQGSHHKNQAWQWDLMADCEDLTLYAKARSSKSDYFFESIYKVEKRHLKACTWDAKDKGIAECVCWLASYVYRANLFLF